MLSYAGDVQAPSLAPSRAPSVDSTKSGRNHTRRTSSRNGFYDLPPGSYGLHGHGVESTDKLEKAYYEKHPEIYQKEHYHPLHDRVHDYSMSSENLNKIVRDTASRGVGFGTSGYIGTPSEQVGFQASDEYTSRISSPQPPPTAPMDESLKSPLKDSSSGPEGEKGDGIIHVDEDGQYKGFVKHGDAEATEDHGGHDESWPILAADEVAKDPSPYELRPAVPPNRGSDDGKSRPSSRPASIYSPPPPELHSTPLEDVEEYEPLFPEDEKGHHKPKTAAEKLKGRFPSQDIWEDAPNSVHSTAEVSTPEPADTRPRSRLGSVEIPPRDTETPAQAFARRQEELAEKEAVTADSFINRQERPKSWVEHQPHLAKEIPSRPNMAQRFPSRDVWEDTPDSLQFTTTVSQPQSQPHSADDSAGEEAAKSLASAAKPIVPVRPPKKQGSGDDGTSKPTIPNRPKPQIPVRPFKPAAESRDSEGTMKPKPIVPPRPMGSKIAALQAGFMSDLNNRLRLGPQAPKKDVPAAEEAPEEKEKAPLADARKGRARGPQRRAPTKSSPGAGVEKSVPPPVSNGRPVLSFSMTRTLWSIDEEGTVMVDNFGPEDTKKPESTVVEVKPEEPEVVEVKEVKEDESKSEETQTEDAKTTEAEAEEVPEQKEPEREPEKEPEKEPEESGKEPEKELEKELEKQPEEASKEPEPTTTDDKPSESQNTVKETKSLVTNTAGEPILTETVDKKEDSDEVKKVEEIKDEVIS
ncbi:hypothetical protein O1611_g9319 [Lasiodiplodia mahajangana]|uniref:Uncharacterized protein n=1 Tax=Lasiodiplodia mahajangana TaxID=1108764 RepID=A0ACC2JAC3_9PEZI|nr:hypothetical protein O1611_g9319 [Lasiodiplodia mahajangana]